MTRTNRCFKQRRSSSWWTSRHKTYRWKVWCKS